MSSVREDDDRHWLAAEYALGLLEGEALRDARRLVDQDEAFRDEVAQWTGRLAPLLDEVEPVSPPEAVWPLIASRIPTPLPGTGNVVQLRRSLRNWRAAAAATSAIAAALALVVVTGPQPAAPPTEAPAPAPAPAAAEPITAALAGEDEDVVMVATWDPSQQRLLVTATADLSAPAGQANELWVIPGDGTPRSLGLLPTTDRARIQVDEALASFLAQGAALAISVEPEGGSPTGAPTGPVIASGSLESA